MPVNHETVREMVSIFIRLIITRIIIASGTIPHLSRAKDSNLNRNKHHVLDDRGDDTETFAQAPRARFCYVMVFPKGFRKGA